MPDAPAASLPTLRDDLAYVISNAARIEGWRLSPISCQAIAAAIIDRPGLIRALADRV